MYKRPPTPPMRSSPTQLHNGVCSTKTFPGNTPAPRLASALYILTYCKITLDNGITVLYVQMARLHKSRWKMIPSQCCVLVCRRLTVVSRVLVVELFHAASLTTVLTSVLRSVTPHPHPGCQHSHPFLASHGGRLPLSHV